MKTKSIITFSLLIALSFSVVHEFAFAYFDDDHCNVTEYVQEFQKPITDDIDVHKPSEHMNDICDIHFEYHQAFLLFPDTVVFPIYDSSSSIVKDKKVFLSHIHQKLIKPPIT